MKIESDNSFIEFEEYIEFRSDVDCRIEVFCRDFSGKVNIDPSLLPSIIVDFRKLLRL